MPGPVSRFLADYGVPETGTLAFDAAPTPDQQDFLTLRELRAADGLTPDGVATSQGRPVLYFVDETRVGPVGPPRPDTHAEIVRRLACRGERAYLASVRPGELYVRPVWADTPEAAAWHAYAPGTAAGRSLFSRLVLGEVEWDDFRQADVLHARLFKLLDAAATNLAEQGVDRGNVLSLVGRALFFRFLRDRRVVRPDDAAAICPAAGGWERCFGSPAAAAQTCGWMDATFNGNFLPLTDGDRPLAGNALARYLGRFSRERQDNAFGPLTAIVTGAEPVGRTYQMLIEWEEFDFAHVPVGLLSQVYESFSHAWFREEAAATSVHYTPRNIALAMVDEVFHGLAEPATCRLLDPACGAGVFLVLAFRRLCREAWQATGRRPNTAAIRRILYGQIRGFDISDSALRLAALGLYLTAIELDPKPVPPEKLVFKDLRGLVLHHARTPADPPNGVVLGSVGPAIGGRFDGRFDAVLGNPPWTSYGREHAATAAAAAGVSAGVISRRPGGDAVAFELPDNNPDWAFVWKATEWAKPGGRIAFALHARVLLKSQPKPRAAREALLDLVDVTGVVNGANVSKTPVWPNMDQPWVLLFAVNRPPPRSHAVSLVTAHYDAAANRRGEVLLDATARVPVPVAAARERPWLWKAMTKGSILDVEVVEAISDRGGVPIRDQWPASADPRRSGNGYTVAERQAQQPAGFLVGRPDITAVTAKDFQFVAAPDGLPRFDRPTVHARRDESIYEPPLVIVKRSPGSDRQGGRAWLYLSRVPPAYSKLFFGYSTAGRPDPVGEALYLHLFLHSQLWLHWSLVRGYAFGVERNTTEKADFDDFPLLPWGRLTAREQADVRRLSEQLCRGDRRAFPALDAFFARLYGLDATLAAAVLDTVNMETAYRETSGSLASKTVADAPAAAFAARVRECLTQYLADVPGFDVRACQPPDPDPPYRTLLIGAAPALAAPLDDLYYGQVLRLGEETGAARIVLADGGRLVVGVRNRARYWTASRAVLLAGTIVRDHLDEIAAQP